MKKSLIILGILFFSTISVFASATGCVYDNGNPLGSFKKCSPDEVIQGGSDPQLDITKPGSDFMTIIQSIVEKIQIIAFFISVGIIVWLGLIMVLPANAEAKESTKSKLTSVLLGFLAMLSATIIINAIINLIYDIFS